LAIPSEAVNALEIGMKPANLQLEGFVIAMATVIGCWFGKACSPERK
jgi:hypothetical protein